MRDGSATLAVVEGGSLKHWTLTLPGGEVIGRVGSGRSSRRYYLKDHLGSIRAVLDGGGGVRETRDYYPFGLPMPGRYEKGSPPTQEDFTGHVKDEETGLHYAGARYYSAAFGRWTTPDPILREKGPKALLKQDARLLTMSSYDYAFDNPLRLVDPTGLAPTDWYRDEDGNIVHDEEVQSQEDLEEGQTYLGENVLDKSGDGPIQLLTEGGERVNVFDEGVSKGEAGAKGMAGASVPAAAQSSLLNAESVTGGKALSRLKVATRLVGDVASGVGFGLSTGSEAAEAYLSEGSFFSPGNFGTYERVKAGADAASLIGSFSGVGAVVAFGAELPTGGTSPKERLVRSITLEILESRVDHAIPR